MLTDRHKSPPEISGYLVKSIHALLRRKSFFRLNGSIITQHKTEAENAKTTAVINIAKALVVKHGRNGIAIVSDTEEFVFYAKSREQWAKWFNAFTAGARHNVETHYHVCKFLGEGGFATVRLGCDKKSKELVAIKSIDKSGTTNTFLRREVQILKAVRHPNIVETFATFETNDEFQIVMEYMGGGILFDSIDDRAGGCFSEPDALHVTHQILKGVNYLHSIGIVHRDLKPQNVLVGGRGRLSVKLADFGLSRFHDSKNPMNTLIGTPQFVAPELIKDKKYGAEVDLWAVGIMLYTFLAGKLPFTEKDVYHIFKMESFEVPYPCHLWYNISPKAKALTKQLLCRDPSKRVSAIGALYHSWFTTWKNTDEEIIPSTSPSLALDREWTPRNAFRKAAHCVCFLLRLSAKAGIINSFAVRTQTIDHAVSCTTTAYGSSNESSNLSDWDFQAEEVEITCISFDEQDSIPTIRLIAPNINDVTSAQEVQAGHQEKLLRDIKARIASAHVKYNRKENFSAQRDYSFTAESMERAYSVGGMNVDKSSHHAQCMGSYSQRAVSDRQIRIGPINAQGNDYAEFYPSPVTTPTAVADTEAATKAVENCDKDGLRSFTEHVKNVPKATKRKKARTWFAKKFAGKKLKDDSIRSEDKKSHA